MKVYIFVKLVLLIAVQLCSCQKSAPTIVLNDGNTIPVLALGTFVTMKEVKQIEQAVIWAVEAGYRHIDTAWLYLNEREVGKAIINVTSRGIVTREELFITTKLDWTAKTKEDVLPALRNSLERLQLDYVNLYLIHIPISLPTFTELDVVDLWRGMQEAKELGLAKSIGVSNFNSDRINKILANTEVRPAVAQFEVNPIMSNLDLVSYCQSEGLAVMSYAPFAFAVTRSFRSISPVPSFEDPLLKKIARKYGKTTSQIFLRYLVDRGTIPIPKSITKERIESNIDIFDFSLTSEDVYTMNEFNINSPVYKFNYTVVDNMFMSYYGHGLDEFPDFLVQ